MRLTEKEVYTFEDQGVLTIDSLFSDDEIGELKDAAVRIEQLAIKARNGIYKGTNFVMSSNESEDMQYLRRAVWAGSAEKVFHRFGRDPRITNIAAQILGSNSANHLINQIHFKPPGDGMYPFHQDSRHRRYGTSDWTDINGRGSFVQILIALDECNINNGPPLFIPGSHKRGHLNLPYDEKKPTLPMDFSPSDAIPAVLNPGDAVVFGPYVIHGSLPNRSSTMRRVFINGFAYPGANRRVYPGDGAGELITIHND